MGSSTKVSIHESGQAQWSMESDWYGRNKPNQPNRGRHIERWQVPSPMPSTATHAFRLSVPESELRAIDNDEDLTEVTWLTAPTPGHKLNVECYLSPKPPEDAPRTEASFLTVLDLDPGRSVVALTSLFPVSEADSAQLELARTTARSEATASGITIEPGFRAVAFFRDANDVRGMIEFVPPVAAA